MKKIKITTEYITLGQFLKFTDFIGSGSEAKYFLLDNEVLVNNETENRRGRKIYPGDTVEIDGSQFEVIQ